MRKLITILTIVLFSGTLFGQGYKSTINGNLYVVKTTSPTITIQGNGGIIDFLSGASHITLTQSIGQLSLAGGNLSLGTNSLLLTGSIGATGARVTKGWFTNAEFTNEPTIGGVALSSLYATASSVSAITATSLGLGNVTNISATTLLTNTALTGVPTAPTAGLGTNTTQVATTAFVLANGGGGGGGGTWGSIAGTLSNQTDLQNALNAKLATNGSAASLTSFPTLNQNTTGSAAKWTTARSLWGNSVDGSANVTSIIASTYGGTGNGFTKFSGATITEKTYTLPNASATILTDNAAVTVAQGGTGRATSTTAYALIAAGATATGAQQTLTNGTSGQVLRSAGAALPLWSTATYPATAGTARKVLMSDGTNFASSTETYAAPGTSGNYLQSDGTNWTSVTPVELSTIEVTTDGVETLTNKTLTSPKINENVAMTTTSTFLNRVDATSSIQGQLNTKLNIADSTTGTGKYATDHRADLIEADLGNSVTTGFADLVDEGIGMIADVETKAVLGAGDGTRGSQSSFLPGKKLGAFYWTGDYSLDIDSIRAVCVQDSGTVTSGIQLYYDVNCFDATPTAILSATANITSTTTGNLIYASGTPHIDELIIPKKSWIWGTVMTKSNGNMPVFMSINIIGHKHKP